LTRHRFYLTTVSSQKVTGCGVEGKSYFQNYSRIKVEIQILITYIQPQKKSIKNYIMPAST